LWLPPPFKSYFQSLPDAVPILSSIGLLDQNKPLLVVHNKYVKEWDGVPINFIDVATLDRLLTLLAPHYTVVYIHPSPTRMNVGTVQYSMDHNEALQLGDFQMIEERHPDVIIFEDIVVKSQDTYSYNKLKMMLYAHCDNYVTVQGGNAMLSGYFANKMVVYHVKGGETVCGSYNGWFHDLNPTEKMELKIAGHPTALLSLVTSMFLPVK
jgi:hypothetical protein